MVYRIEILCPARNCPRCKRFVKFMEEFIEKNQINADLIIITKLKEILKFNTWILPSIFINGQKISRGYIPKNKDINKYLSFK